MLKDAVVVSHDRTNEAEVIVRDPVCGMTCEAGGETTTYRYAKHEYSFCNPKCREKFIADPNAYTEGKDPVCEMMVNRGSARFTSRHNGERLYFCSSRCEEKFEGDPNSFLAGRAAPEPMPEGTLYTCPMDPEIVQEGPGDCPKCGMALEPMGVQAGDQGPNPELVDFTFRFKVGAVLTIPLLIIAMGPMFGLPIRSWLGAAGPWLELILATPVVLWCAAPFFKRGWASIVNQSPNMWTLIALGVGAAYGFSIFATVAPGIFPAAFRDGGGHVGVYYEAAAVIVVLVLLGQILELRARANGTYEHWYDIGQSSCELR